MNSSTQVNTTEVHATPVDATRVDATRVPPVIVFVRTASLGSSVSRYLRDRGAELENGPMNRVLPKKFGRGVLYEA
jgi:hypothetical protein